MPRGARVDDCARVLAVLPCGLGSLIDRHWPHPDSDGMPRRGGAPGFSARARDVGATFVVLVPRCGENLRPHTLEEIAVPDDQFGRRFFVFNRKPQGGPS